MASFQEVFAGKRFVSCALTVLSIYTSECKALWGEPEEAPFFSICAHTYVTAAGGPVCHLHALQLVYPTV